MNTENNDNNNLSLHELLLKQHELLLKQSQVITKDKESQKREDDEIDLTRLVPSFLKKKNPTKENSTETFETNDKKESDTTRSFSISNQIVACKKFLYRWKLMIILPFIVGIAFGVYKFTFDKKVYSTQMILSSGEFQNSFYEGLLNPFHLLSNSKSYNELSRKLNIPIEVAEKITDIKYAEYTDYEIIIVEETDSTEQIVDYPFFSVVVEITDNSILPKLETELFNYLDNNKYGKQKRDINREILTQSILQYDKEIALMDSLKMAVIMRIGKKKKEDSYFVKETGIGQGGIILSQEDKLEIEPLVPFNKGIDLYTTQLSKQTRLLNLDNNFTMIDGFSAIDRPVYPRVRHIALFSIYGIILGLLLSLFLSVFVSNKNRE